MNRRNLPFNALRAFEAAARHASVSAAARELSVTHSAISHQLKLLESQLGTRLFERTNRGLKITASGEILLPVLSESFDSINATLTHLQQGQGAGVTPRYHQRDQHTRLRQQVAAAASRQLVRRARSEPYTLAAESRLPGPGV